MVVIVIIALLVLGLISLALFVNYITNKKYLLDNFKINNVIVAGKKGKGKDMLFQYVINKRKKFYYSNISYGGKHKIIKPREISCEPNNYLSLINETIEKQPHNFKEGADIYLSDGGNILPSQYDSTLHKKFTSMPLYYALSRHLYGSNIHVNVQNFDRLWKALREQADFYIQVKSTRKILGFYITRFYTYDRYDSARNNLLPMKKRMFNKFSKAQYDLYTAQNGEIRKMYIIQRKKDLKYDTRAYEKILLKGRRKH